MILTLGLFYLTACRSGVVNEKEGNTAPAISIVSHDDGAEVQEGFVEYFQASVSDSDNGFDELSVAWYVGEDIVCDWGTVNSAGESACELVFAVGDGNVVATARDSLDAEARAEISIVVAPTEAPVVELLTPIAGENYYSDVSVPFSALVSDAEDDAEQLIVTWISSVDGGLSLDDSIIADGESSGYSYLSEGNHTIELRVEDTTGKVSTDEVVIDVGGANSIPSCAFVTPEDGSAFVIGDSILFTGLVTDEDISNTELTVDISSSLDGDLQRLNPDTDGFFSFETSALSTGTHTVTLLASDEAGAQCNSSLVVSAGTPPTTTIDLPLDGAVITVGEPVTFRGTVSDGEDPSDQIALVWSSDIDGELDSGNASAQGVSEFIRSELSAGVHSISLTATDTIGLVSDDTISIRLNTLPVVDSIILSPDPVYTTDNLMVTATGSDADGQNVTLIYEWLEDGSLTSFTGATIDATEIDVGEIWTVRVTPNDGFQAGSYVEQSITVSNTDPTITSATISPNSNLSASSVLTCSATGSDADDGALTPTYTWAASGGAASTGATWQLDPSLISGTETITCTASVIDGNGATASSTSSSVTVTNTPPTSTGIAISPSSGVVTGSTLSCSVGFNDLEDGSLAPTYVWTVGGNSVSNTSTYALTSADTNVGDSVACTASATDSDGNTVTDTVSVTVENTAPTLSNVSITSSDVANYNTSIYTCAATVIDIDDNCSTTYTWSVGGTGIGNGTNTLDAATEALLSGDEVMCTVEVTDGDDGSISSQSTSVTVDSACGLTNCDVNIDLGGGQSIDMVLIPSGSDPLGRYDITSDFYLMTTEVTQGMFTELMSYDPTTYSTTYGVGNDFPVYYLNWHMAADFANKVTQRHNSLNGTALQECYTCSNSGSTGVTCTETVNPYQCSGYVLPTEAEWGYAARSGTPYNFWTPHGGGNYSANACIGTETIQDSVNNPLLSEYAWYCANNQWSNASFSLGSKEVGQKLPNGFGVYDMHGNLWEWTADWYGCSFPLTSTDPYCSSPGSNRVKRGGYWGNTSDGVRASYRSANISMERVNNIGFRLARHPMTAPSAASIAIANQVPLEQVDDLYCEILVDSIDPDGNAITYTFDWTVDGIAYIGTSTTTAYSGDTIPASETIASEVWECTVTPNDGTEDGAISTDSVTIASNCGLTDCDANLDLGGGQSMDMVLIPNGTFTMGSPASEVGRGSDEVQHTVTLTNDYYVMTTEVTQGMFAEIMGYNSHDGETTSTSSGSYGIGNDYPAYYVSWHMAADFANQVTQRHNSMNGTNLQECYACSGSGTGVTCSVSVNPYQCTGYRMLTEAEWEYAARAGTTAAFWTPNGGGNLPSGYSNTTSTLTDGSDLRLYGHYYATYNNPYGSKEVAQLLPNDYGLYDMSGNLWEWTQDWYGTYSAGSVANPTGINSASTRVVRGGYWVNSPYILRSAKRHYNSSSLRAGDIGFRLGITVITQPSAASIAIAYQSPLEQVDDLYCEILVDSIDPDGNSITYTFDWTVDGIAYNGTSTTTAYSGDTIPASETIAGEVWECTVTPNDGTENGLSSADSVTIVSSCGLTDCDANLDLGGGESIDMVLIPNGTFTMGSPSNENGRLSDEAQHTVTLTNDYYVMTTEVTQGMFYQIMGYQSYDGQSSLYGTGNNYPAYYVSWHMAADFANAVTQRHNSVNGTNLQECYACSGSGTGVTCGVSLAPYQCDGYRMLTESEWEYAARAGTTAAFWTPSGGGDLPSGYSGTTSTLTDGFDLLTYGHYLPTANSPYGSKEVAQLVPNDYGLYDMSGNVWEWTQDWYSIYATGSVINPAGSNSGSSRVIRGADWGNPSNYLRSALRGYNPPTHRGATIGFRLALSP